MTVPKIEVLAHYQKQLRDALADLETSLSAITPERRAEELRDTMLAIALRAATFEAQHQGPFNHSGKELYWQDELTQDPAYPAFVAETSLSDPQEPEAPWPNPPF